MERLDFLLREAINTPEIELKIRAVFSENTALHEENSALKDELSVLKERLAWFEKQVYGQKSEKTEVVLENAEQLPLFDEAEQTADVNLKNPEYIDVKASKRIKRTRDEIYADMEVEEVYHAVEDKTCDKCGAEMTVIGKEKIRDELVYVPARMFLRRHIAEVAKCTACGTDESRDADQPDIEPCHIRTAEVPAPMIPHSFCTPELLAHIAYEKYCKAVPLTPLEKDFKAKGV
jgi:transposase